MTMPKSSALPSNFGCTVKVSTLAGPLAAVNRPPVPTKKPGEATAPPPAWFVIAPSLAAGFRPAALDLLQPRRRHAQQAVGRQAEPIQVGALRDAGARHTRQHPGRERRRLLAASPGRRARQRQLVV